VNHFGLNNFAKEAVVGEEEFVAVAEEVAVVLKIVCKILLRSS